MVGGVGDHLQTGLGPLILDAVLIDSLEKYDQSLSARTADADAATMMAAAKIEEALLDACRVYSTWYAAQTANVGGKAALPDPDINRRYQVIVRPPPQDLFPPASTSDPPADFC